MADLTDEQAHGLGRAWIEAGGGWAPGMLWDDFRVHTEEAEEAEGTGHECATCGGCGSVEMSGGAHVAPCPQCVEADDG